VPSMDAREAGLEQIEQERAPRIVGVFCSHRGPRKIAPLIGR